MQCKSHGGTVTKAGPVQLHQPWLFTADVDIVCGSILEAPQTYRLGWLQALISPYVSGKCAPVMMEVNPSSLCTIVSSPLVPSLWSLGPLVYSSSKHLTTPYVDGLNGNQTPNPVSAMLVLLGRTALDDEPKALGPCAQLRNMGVMKYVGCKTLFIFFI